MEDSTKRGQLISYSLLIFLTLVLIVFAWLLFYSNALANYPLVIGLRGQYDQVFRKITKRPAYSIAPIQKGNFNYRFYGKFRSLDTNTQELVLTGFDNRTYVFRVPNTLIGYGDTDLIDNNPGDKVLIYWQDSRSLSQIKQDYYNNPQAPINPNDSFSITKID